MGINGQIKPEKNFPKNSIYIKKVKGASINPQIKNIPNTPQNTENEKLFFPYTQAQLSRLEEDKVREDNFKYLYIKLQDQFPSRKDDHMEIWLPPYWRFKKGSDINPILGSTQY